MELFIKPVVGTPVMVHDVWMPHLTEHEVLIFNGLNLRFLELVVGDVPSPAHL